MARLPNNLIVTENEVSQTFNVADITGVDLSDQEDLKQAIAQEIIDKIVERSKAGEDIRGASFKPYKSSYKKSEAFSAFGKGDNVNMTLSGDMLASIQVLDTTGNEIKIGFESGDALNNAKAFNHMEAVTAGAQKRQFFGMSKSSVSDIINRFKPDIKKIKEQSDAPDNITQFINQIGQSAEVTADQFSDTSLITLGELFGES